MKKKIIAIFLSLSIPFSLVSCKNSPEKLNGTESKPSTSTDIVDKDTSSNTVIDSEKEDSEKEETATIYYYDVVTDKIVYINKVINSDKNEIATALVNELKISPTDEIFAPISNEVNLKSAEVNKDTSTIALDFSSNFINSNLLGSSTESGVIHAVCNTFGSYFNVDNVIITLDGEPYSSGHILMNEGEAFKVNLDNSTELK